ncbi:hypothetical protein CEP51_005466 [Fusarium floridanum]|uniref:Uncharacterized protein n=1 Tax=Fusarium floridanum TaxID=1325733 RepID=A0A428RWR6_9HYPO|nr:hypothetical protein CEP51_005466 [Fusarium floridanum]
MIRARQKHIEKSVILIENDQQTDSKSVKLALGIVDTLRASPEGAPKDGHQRRTYWFQIMAQAYRRAQGLPEPAGTNTGVSARGSDGKAKFNLDDQKDLGLRKLYDDQEDEEEASDSESGEESDSSMENADEAQESEGSSDEEDEEEDSEDDDEDDEDGEFSNEEDDGCGKKTQLQK